jgi:hypothetical protein
MQLLAQNRELFCPCECYARAHVPTGMLLVCGVSTSFKLLRSVVCGGRDCAVKTDGFSWEGMSCSAFDDPQY